MEAKRTVQDIEKTIREMDQQYDANFGDWVQSEENIDILAFNFKKYINRYSPDTFAEVLKWVTNMWSSSCRMTFLKKLFLPGLFLLKNEKEADLPKKKTLILKTLISSQWTPFEISELIVEFIPALEKEEKKIFLLWLLEDLSHQKLAEVFIRTDSVVDWSLRLSIIKKGRGILKNRKYS